MNVHTALEIVICLAQQASISDKEAEQDPEVLKPLASMQEEAIKVVSDFFDRIGR